MTQESATGQSPICAAIDSGNIDFIKQVMESPAALKTPWAELVDTGSVELLKALNKQFEVASRTAYNRKQFSQDDRFTFQVSLIKALQAHLDARIS